MLISRHIPPRLKLAGSSFYAWLVGVSYWGTNPAHSTSTNRRILMCNQYVLASFMLAVPFFLLKIDEPKPRLIFVLFWGLMISSLWLNKKGAPRSRPNRIWIDHHQFILLDGHCVRCALA